MLHILRSIYMKFKFIKACALLAVPAVALGAFGCTEPTNVGENKSYYLEDDGVYPVVAAEYEEESKAAISRWKNAGSDRDEVAKEVAAELFAYACYNEEYIDRYVYFSSQTGTTDLGSNGSGNVTTQNYKLIIRESEITPGYKYHYTIKKVNEAEGFVNTFKGQFESARMRFVEDTDKLYRFEGIEDTIAYATDEETGEETDILTCEWETGNDWGSDDTPITKREDRLNIDGIEADILSRIENDYEAVIHCNVNILADGIIESATITEGTADGHAVYEIVMQLDADVANADEASLKLLKDANSPASSCKWIEDEEGNGPTITFQIWDNGLLKYYKMEEQWEGRVILFNGKANSQLEVWYSYSNDDCDMNEKAAWLEEAKEAKEDKDEPAPEEADG